MRISDWSSDVCSSDLLRAAQSATIDLRRHFRLREQMRRLITASRGVVVTLAVMRHDCLHLPSQHQRRVQMAVLHDSRLVHLPHFVELAIGQDRSEEHTSELQSLMRISYAVFCLKKKKTLQILPATY